MSKNEICKYLFKLSAIFPDRKLEAEAIEIYCAELSDLSDEQLKIGIARCIRECRFYPTISEILEKSESGMDAEISENFFGIIDGLDVPPEYQRAINAVGGKKELQTLKTKDLLYLRRDFISYVKEFKKHDSYKRLETGLFEEVPRRISA